MIIENCSFPDNLCYDIEENVWVQRDKGKVTIGITCIYASIAGRISTVKFKPLGTFVERGKSVATIESSTFFGAVRSPIDGKLAEINQELVSTPSLTYKHPYSLGWFARVIPVYNEEESVGESQRLVSPKDVEGVLRNKIEELHIRCFSVYPDYEISGIGGECPETLGKLDELMQSIRDDETVHLATDNPIADKDVPRWASVRGCKILETRREGTLLHFILGK